MDQPALPSSPPKRSLLVRIFLSPPERRLRAGWRLMIQTILLGMLLLCLGLIILIPYMFLARQQLSGIPFLILNEIVEFLAFTGSVFLARRFLDRRFFITLGFKLDRRTLIDLLAGIGITFVMMGGIYLAMSWLGWIHFEGFAWQSEPPLSILGSFLAILFVWVMTGWNEELLSRGYHLQTIASGTNVFVGVVLSSAIFGMLHLSNPNAGWVAVTGIFFAGLFLAYAYLRTGQLWLSIGLHIGWNFFEGTVFGFMVSGMQAYRLTHITINGPVLWTGGEFGPEAGLVILPAIAFGALLIFLYTRHRPRATPPT